MNKTKHLGGNEKMLKKAGYSSGPFTVDEIGFIQIAPGKVLLAAAKGEIDLNQIAREEMAARGLGLHGEWVGFEKARKVHGLDEAQTIDNSTDLLAVCREALAALNTAPRFKVLSNGISPTEDTDSYAIASRLEKAIAMAEDRTAGEDV